MILLFFFVTCHRSSQHKEAGLTADTLPTDSMITGPVVADSFMVTDTLPVCINYNESAFDGEGDFDYLGYAAGNKKYLRGKRLLSLKALKGYGFGDTIYLQNIWQHDTIDTELIKQHLESNTYYLLDTVLHASAFTGVLIEHVNGHGSQKILLNFDKAGHLVARQTIALYHHSGSYTHSDGGRRPWWPRTEGCISRDMIIEVHGDGIAREQYTIRPDGHIVKN